jgi:hypothetical protein
MSESVFLQAVRKQAGLIFLALIPIAVWLTNANVLGNANGDVDTWFYFGDFLGLGKYGGYEFNGPGDYYATRLPYILPGYAIFHILPLLWAKVVFAYLVYVAAIWALFYTFRSVMPERTAVLALLLIATDIFFTRAVNWNYVDAGAIVYQALTFAALTAARNTTRKRFWIGAAAFSFTSSVFCHLGVVFSIFPLAIYAWFCLEPMKLSRKEILGLFYAALAGAALCQIVFGLLNVVINGGDFFFFLLLYKIAHGESHSMQAWHPAWELLRDCPWLTVPFAIWIASGLALIAAVLQRLKFEPFQWAMLLGAFFTCSLIYSLDALHITYFLSRSGMYATLYLVVGYVGMAALVSLGPRPSLPATLAVGAAFLVALLIRLHYNATGIAWLPQIGGVWKAGLVLGLLLAVSFVMPRASLKAALLCLAAVPTLFIQWQFDDTRDAYTAFQAMRQMANGELPRIWARLDDPLYRNVILPMTASFSERGWWARGDMFPEVPPDAWSDDTVFIASSTIHSLEEARKLVAPHVERIVPVRQRILHLSQGDLWIGEFRAWNRMGFLGKISPELLQQGKAPASEMFSSHGRVVGGSRVAVEGDKGLLMFGPYMALARGKYLVTIVYGPSSGDQIWDVVSQQNDRATRIVGGKLAPTNRTDARVTTTLDLTKKAIGLEIRARYSGTGKLAVHFVGVKPLTP